MKNLTPELIAKAKTAASADELFAIAKENNVALTEEEAKTYFAQLNANGAVADEELDLVAGGCGGDSEDIKKAKDNANRGQIKCPKCNKDIARQSGIFECPECGASLNSSFVNF